MKVAAMADSYRKIYDREPFYLGSGGTIPVTAAMPEELGIHSLVFGFCTRDEQIHAPNGFFRRSSFATAQERHSIFCWTNPRASGGC